MAKPEIFRSGRNYGTTFGRISKNWDYSVFYSGRRSSSTASRSPFPPGEGIFLSSARQTPICRTGEPEGTFVPPGGESEPSAAYSAGEWKKYGGLPLTLGKIYAKIYWLNRPEDAFCGCSSMVEHQPSKLDTRVRFPSPAPSIRASSSAG